MITYGIVNAGAHAADTAVTFQILQTCLFGFFDKFRIQIGVSGYKRNIHK